MKELSRLRNLGNQRKINAAREKENLILETTSLMSRSTYRVDLVSLIWNQFGPVAQWTLKVEIFEFSGFFTDFHHD